MFTLFHHPFCPRSRFVRLALGEHGLDTRLVEELVWDRREAFLMLNPAGDTPVLIAEGTPAMPGPGLAAEFLDEIHGAPLGDHRLLPRDEADINHCGSCQACLDICPTNAFPAPSRLDARKCISYLTIEHKGAIPRDYRAAIGNRIYGCDDCLSVCPWNKFAQEGHETKLAARDELRAPSLAELSRLDDASFRALFTKSPVKRIGRDRFLRNVLTAIGNSADKSLAPEARRLLDDQSPLVRGAAVWALSRLLPHTEFTQLAGASRDDDEDVQSEWTTALTAAQDASASPAGP